jgi:hypothetical protein
MPPRRLRLTSHQCALVHGHFRYNGTIATCLGCSLAKAKNATRQYEHILSCIAPNLSIAAELRQGSLNPPSSLTHQAHKDRLSEMCYKAVFFGGKPFNHFDKVADPYQYELLKDLGTIGGLSDWEPPSGSSVDQTLKPFYEKRLEMARKQIKLQSCIGFAADESADAANRRVLNVSAMSPHFGPVFICNLDMEDTKYLA